VDFTKKSFVPVMSRNGMPMEMQWLFNKFHSPQTLKSLEALKPVHKSVHGAVVDGYVKFVGALKGFLSVKPLIRLIWCFSASPEVLAVRAMCELRDGVEKVISKGASSKKLDLYGLVSPIRQFRTRVLTDLVGKEDTEWVKQAGSRIQAFEEVLEREERNAILD